MIGRQTACGQSGLVTQCSFQGFIPSIFLSIELDKFLCNDTLTNMIVKFYLQMGSLCTKSPVCERVQCLP